MAAVDYFLKVDGIEGESSDDKHKAEIDVQSWSYSEQQSGTSSGGGGGGAGKVSMGDFRFTMISRIPWPNGAPKFCANCRSFLKLPTSAPINRIQACRQTWLLTAIRRRAWA